MRPKPGAAALTGVEPAPCRSQTRLQLPGGSLPVNVRDALGRPWLPQIPGLTPGEGGSPHLHNHPMFLTCLYPSVSALNHAPQPYGPVPGREGGARIARQQTPHYPPPPTVTGTELGLLTLT